MCMMSVVTAYGQGVSPNSWTPGTWKQFVDLTKQVEVLDTDLGEPECIDPGKAEWMREMEERMRALEAHAFRNSAFRQDDRI